MKKWNQECYTSYPAKYILQIHQIDSSLHSKQIALQPSTLLCGERGAQMFAKSSKAGWCKLSGEHQLQHTAHSMLTTAENGVLRSRFGCGYLVFWIWHCHCLLFVVGISTEGIRALIVVPSRLHLMTRDGLHVCRVSTLNWADATVLFEERDRVINLQSGTCLVVWGCLPDSGAVSYQSKSNSGRFYVACPACLLIRPFFSCVSMVRGPIFARPVCTNPQ